MYAYKQITVPAGQSYLTISLKAKLQGEGSYDCVVLYLVPATVSITPDVPLDNAYRLFILYNGLELISLLEADRWGARHLIKKPLRPKIGRLSPPLSPSPSGNSPRLSLPFPYL